MRRSPSQICASILGNEWSPVLSVVAVCVTLQSMLASCKVNHDLIPHPYFTHFIYRRKNGTHDQYVIPAPSVILVFRPQDNDRYVRYAPDNPKKVSVIDRLFCIYLHNSYNPPIVHYRLASTMTVRSQFVYSNIIVLTHHSVSVPCSLDDT